ncbi:MAG: hypothetical protein Q8L48_22250 [Archangium sp.]|nr:hypothetical protein [Archangium sp.]
MKNLLLPAVVLSLSLLGCGRGEELDSAEDADESAVVTSSESALTSELSDEVTQPMSATPENLASTAATRVGTRLKPAGCLTTTVNGATVTYVMVDCTGPYGLVKVSGTLTAVYSRGAGGAVQVVISGTGIKANSAVIDVNATVLATQVNGVKKADVVSNSSGTGPRGGSISREGTYTVTYDPTAECVTVDGTWTTKAGVRTGTTVVSGYQRCKGTCPAAGGTIVHTQGRFTVTMSYDGTAVANWETAAGRSGTVNLRCGG